MKDVIEILSKRLARLESSFSLQWTSDFLMLMEYLKVNQATQHIMSSIQEKKKHAHMSLFELMQSLFKDGSNCLKQVLHAPERHQRHAFGALAQLTGSKFLLKMKILKELLFQPELHSSKP